MLQIEVGRVRKRYSYPYPPCIGNARSATRISGNLMKRCCLLNAIEPSARNLDKPSISNVLIVLFGSGSRGSSEKHFRLQKGRPIMSVLFGTLFIITIRCFSINQSAYRHLDFRTPFSFLCVIFIKPESGLNYRIFFLKKKTISRKNRCTKRQ